MADDAKDDIPAADQTDEEILAEARERYRQCPDANDENRADARDDLLFLKGGRNQWDEKALAQRDLDGRPIITVNSLPTYLHQVTNDQRQNTPSIKVHPVDDNADLETAKVRQGLIRHIEYDSNADVAYDRAVNSAAAIGFGYFRIMPEYESESSFNQKLMFKSVRNSLSVRPGPHLEPDGSDMQFCFVEDKMPRSEFKRKHPKANACNASAFSDSTYLGWITDAEVLVCEYYRIEKEDAQVVELSNGEEGFKDDLVPPGGLPPGLTIMRERTGTRSKVMWRKITGADILETAEIKCKHIPVYPVYGDEVDIEGKVTRSGIIRHAKGPAQMYNVMMSGATEEVALRTKSPWVMAEGQAEGHEDDWEQANSRAFPYIEYKPTTVGDKLAPPPQRQPMADVPVGMLALAAHASDNVKKTTGLFDASLGARGTATSGKQEIAQQREGDMANFHYADGLLRTIRRAGKDLNYMIRYYYDAQRTVRILGEDDSADYATINKPEVKQVQGPSGEITAVETVVNDMTSGEYDVTVTAGPSYSTMRQESAEFFANAMQAAKDPATASVVTYLAMKNQDVPGAEIATKMMAKLLPPPAQAVLEQENGNAEGEQQPMVDTPQGPIPAQQAGQVIAQLTQAAQQMEEQLKKGEGAKAQEAALKQQHAMREQELEPGRQALELKKAEADIAKANADIAKAEAAKAQALVDLERAKIEGIVLPERLKIEGAQATEKAIKADMELRAPPEAPPMPTADEIAAAMSAARPPVKGMTIKSKLSGQVYDVTVH